MMLAELVQNSSISALVLKIFLETVLVLVFRSLVKSDSENILSWAYGAVLFFLIRDLAIAAIPNSALQPLSDTLAPFFLVGALRWKSDRNRVLFFGAAALGLGFAAFLASIANADYRFIQGIAALTSAVAALLMLRKPGKDTQGKFPIGRMGKICLAVGFMAAPFAVATGADLGIILGGIIVPIAYLALIAAALDYGFAGVSALIVDRDGIAENIDTLYGFVLNSSDALRAGGDLDKLMNYVAQTMASETGADGSLVLMVDDFEDTVNAYALSGNFTPISAVPEDTPRSAEGIRDWLAHLKVPLGEGIIGEAAQSGKAIFLKEAYKDGRITTHPSFPVGSLMAVPFLIETRVIGVGVVVRRKGTDPFTDKEFDRVSLLADFSSLVINNIFSFQDVTERSDIDTAASIAEDIQKAMQPKRVPKISSLSLGIHAESARGVCSDYFDIIAARKNRVYLVMGDIAGKGIQAGLIMVMIRAIIHLVTNTDRDAATILSWINKGITGKIDLDHFATLQIIVMDPTTGACEYANAGHRPLLVWRQSMGLVDAVESDSVPIGVEKGTDFSSVKFTLDKDDVLLSYTDGVVETINDSGRQYGIKSLTGALHKFHELPAPEIAQKIREDIRAFIGSARQHDDQTVLVVKARQ